MNRHHSHVLRLRAGVLILAVMLCAGGLLAATWTAAALQWDDDEERRLVVNRLELMQFALPALMEAERHDAVDLLCRAIHAYEMMTNDRSDPAARIIRARAPKQEEIVELMRMAEALYREFGVETKAETMRRNIESLWTKRGAQRERREREPREREQGDRSEREIARHYIVIMRTGIPALLEAGRRDTADLLEHAIHARELALEGRRDEEAIHIRESAPELGAQIEILNYAANLWDEFGHESKAGQLRELAAHFRQTWERRQGREREPRERERQERREDWRAEARRALVVMGYARDAYREVEAGDAAELMHFAIRALECRLEGRDDAESRQIFERAPSRGMQIELLQRASGILQEFGAGEKAQVVNGLAERLAASARRERQTDQRGERERDDRGNAERELEEIRATLRELQHALEDTMRRLEEVSGRLR